MTDPSGLGSGIVLLVSTGEEVDVSVGVGYAWVQTIG